MAALMSGVAFTAMGDIQPGYFGTTSALSSGKWVKIKVSATGMQQITPQQLAEWGFPDPSKVAVCGYGGAALYLDQVTDNVPDDVKPVPSLYDGKRLMFYGIADLHYTATRPTENSRWNVTVRRNYYADYGCYFLTDAIQPETPVNVPFKQQYNVSRDEAFSILHVEKEERNPELGARFFFGDLSDAQTHSIPLDLTGYFPYPDSGLSAGQSNRASMHVSGVLAYSVNNWGNSRWSINPGGTAQTFSLQRRDKGECVYEAQNNMFLANPAATEDGRYTLDITLDNVGINYAALDFIDVTYRRRTDMVRGGQQSFIIETGNNADHINFTNASENLAVWDITDSYRPYVYEVDHGAGNLARISLQPTVSADRSYLPTLVAFDPETDLHAVEKAGDVDPQNLHALSTPDLVIVSAPGFMDQAERLADIHRSKQGMDVVVVNHNIVYNEFSSGTPSVTGIRRFLRMLYDREPGKLKAVLLLGGCSWDNRNITNFPGAEEYFVPIYQDQSLISAGYMSRSYATDAIYGMLSDDFSTVGRRGSRWSDNLAAQMEISVGRLPARNAEDCRNMVDKVEDYMNNLPFGDTFSRVLVSADRGTKNAFAQQADDIAAIVKANFPDAGITKGYSQFFYNTAGGNGNNTPEFLRRALSRGTNFWYYTGHAAPTNIGSGDAPYWNTSDVNTTDYDVSPFVIFATCRSAYYDHGADNIITTMLKKNNGGIIGGIGALREVYLNNNHVFGKLATEAYFTSPANTLQGDVFRSARNKMATQARVSDTDSVNIVNTSCYNFLGDPAVPIFLPSEKIKVTAVNGVTSGTAVVTPLTAFHITGTVGPDGNASESFNGELMVSIYDAPQNLTAYDRYDNIDYYFDTTLDNDIIYNTCAEVRNGRFDVSVILPVPARTGVSNRVVLYANTPDGTRRAVGSYDDLVVNPVDGFADGSSFLAPVIEAMYLDAPSFIDGDMVSSTPTLYAEIGADEAGLVGDSPIFGQSLAIILDDSKTSYNAGGLLKHLPDGSATLAYPVSDLSDGPHSLTLRISNNAGQSSTRTINFTVVNTPLTATVTVDEIPATTKATIRLDHFYNDLTDTRLIISDMAGNPVFADPSASFPYTWNLRDHDGNPVAPGRYRIDVKLHTGLKYGAAVQGELIVVD